MCRKPQVVERNGCAGAGQVPPKARFPGESDEAAGGSGWGKTSHLVPAWWLVVLELIQRRLGQLFGGVQRPTYEFTEYMLAPLGLRKPGVGGVDTWPAPRVAIEGACRTAVLPGEGQAGSHLPHPPRGARLSQDGPLLGAERAHGGGWVSRACGTGDALGPCRSPPPFPGLVAGKDKQWPHRPHLPAGWSCQPKRQKGSQPKAGFGPFQPPQASLGCSAPTEAPRQSPRQQQGGERMASDPSQRKRRPSGGFMSVLIEGSRPHLEGAATPPEAICALLLWHREFGLGGRLPLTPAGCPWGAAGGLVGSPQASLLLGPCLLQPMNSCL